MVKVITRLLLRSNSMPNRSRETADPTIRRTSSDDGLVESAVQPEWQPLNRQQAPLDLRQVVIQRDDELVISIRDKLDQACEDHAAGSWAQKSICRVPHYLKQSDDKAYVPKVVSLGPYHRGNTRLRKMDRHKWRCLHRILDRTKQDVKMYVDSIRELEAMARACYEEPIDLSIDEFVEMLVLDGCFVLELFQGTAGGLQGFKELGYPPNDPVFAMRGSMHSIQRDMTMLENQLPLFVLDRLLGLQLGDPDRKGQVAKLALRFFRPLIPTDERLTKSGKNKREHSRGDVNISDRRSSDRRTLHVSRRNIKGGGRDMMAAAVRFDIPPIPMDEPLIKSEKNKQDSSRGAANISDPSSYQSDIHCLDVFRKSLLAIEPPSKGRNGINEQSRANAVVDKRRQQLIHCVTELTEAGVRFRKRKTPQFWDIEFKNGTLWIPRLVIEDGTRSLFLNLIAFEQSHLPYCSNHITSYMIFMDNLINSPEDVRHLRHRGIIEHWLGSDAEVAVLFNKLCEEVVFDIDYSYLSKLSEDVNLHCRRRRNIWVASLKQTYFKNPWAIISLVAAAVLLLLTFAQTFYSVYGYYRPFNS